MELLALDLLSLLATLLGLGSVFTGNFSNDTASADRKSLVFTKWYKRLNDTVRVVALDIQHNTLRNILFVYSVCVQLLFIME